MANHDDQAPLYVSAAFCLSSLINRALMVDHISSLPLIMVLSTASAIKCLDQSVKTSIQLLCYTSCCYLLSAFSVLLLQIHSFFVSKVSSVPLYVIKEFKMLRPVLVSEELHAVGALVKFAVDSVNTHISFLT